MRWFRIFFIPNIEWIPIYCHFKLPLFLSLRRIFSICNFVQNSFVMCVCMFGCWCCYQSVQHEIYVIIWSNAVPDYLRIKWRNENSVVIMLLGSYDYYVVDMKNRLVELMKCVCVRERERGKKERSMCVGWYALVYTCQLCRFARLTIYFIEHTPSAIVQIVNAVNRHNSSTFEFKY